MYDGWRMLYVVLCIVYVAWYMTYVVCYMLYGV